MLFQEFYKSTPAGPGMQRGVLWNTVQRVLIAWRNSSNDFSFHDGSFCYFTMDWTVGGDPTSKIQYHIK